MAEVEKHEISPIQKFSRLAQNMPMIWETIMSYLHEKDVSNLLEACKECRKGLCQTLKNHWRLRRDMDLSATIRAADEGRIESVVKVQYWPARPCSRDVVVALDDAFYFRNSPGSVGIARPDLKQVVIEGDMGRVSPGSHEVHPTLDSERVFVQLRDCMDLVNLGENCAEIKSDYFAATDGVELQLSRRPCLSRCRLALHKRPDIRRVLLTMYFLDEQGKITGERVLHELRGRLEFLTCASYLESMTQVRDDATVLAKKVPPQILNLLAFFSGQVDHSCVQQHICS